jgi:hypothetical protein
MQTFKVQPKLANTGEQAIENLIQWYKRRGSQRFCLLRFMVIYSTVTVALLGPYFSCQNSMLQLTSKNHYKVIIKFNQVKVLKRPNLA